MTSLDNNKHRLKFYKEELSTAKKNLFNGGSVREVKMIQERIRFLDNKINELQGINPLQT